MSNFLKNISISKTPFSENKQVIKNNNNNYNSNYEIVNNIKEIKLSKEYNEKLNNFFLTQIKLKTDLRTFLKIFKNTIFISTKERLLIKVENHETAKIIYNNFFTIIEKILHDNWNNNIKIEILYLENSIFKELKQNIEQFEKDYITKTNSNNIVYFNEYQDHYSFQNFISCSTNKYALEICKSIACFQDENCSTNQLQDLVSSGSIVYLYGESGCGKTHLLKAIKSYYENEGGKVFYINAESLLKQYANSARNGLAMDFKDQILNNDIILFDNIKILAGKVGTLAAITSVIIQAVEMNKFIVLASDISTNKLIESDIKFKNFISNVIAINIKEPDYELKKSVIMKEIIDKNLNIPISVVNTLALKIIGGIREIKTAIKKISIVQSVRKFELNESLIMEILSDQLIDNANNQKFINKNKIDNISTEHIISIVANFYKISEQSLQSKIKTNAICHARNVAIYMIKILKNLNYSDIGNIFKKSHSTIIHSINTIESMLEENKKLPGDIADIKNLLINF